VRQNASLPKGDVAQAVDTLKQEDGKDLHVIGSTQLVHTLLEHDLVDGYRLMIDPLVIGGGKRVFRDDGEFRPMQLVESKVATTGAILAIYASRDADE
jgi:dihydrofolate reductase